jgi:hypothetical protein
MAWRGRKRCWGREGGWATRASTPILPAEFSHLSFPFFIGLFEALASISICKRESESKESRGHLGYISVSRLRFTSAHNGEHFKNS